METNISPEISIDDLQDKYRELAEIIGVETLFILSDYFGGTDIYIPKRSTLFRNQNYNKICEEYDGGNIKQLAVKYDVSERTIYRIVENKLKKMRRAPLEGQLRIMM